MIATQRICKTKNDRTRRRGSEPTVISTIAQRITKKKESIEKKNYLRMRSIIPRVSLEMRCLRLWARVFRKSSRSASAPPRSRARLTRRSISCSELVRGLLNDFLARAPGFVLAGGTTEEPIEDLWSPNSSISGTGVSAHAEGAEAEWTELLMLLRIAV